MRVSLVQLNCVSDRDRNLRQALELMTRAVREDDPDLIVLPEHFDWSGGTVEQKLAAADRMPGGAAYTLIQEFARANAVHVHAGSLLEVIPEDPRRIYNTTVVFDPSGNELGRYRKIHLFDVTTRDGREYRESDSVKAGAQLLVYELHGFRIGCAICYDLRFSRLFDRLAEQGMDLLILPAAFKLQTGKDHWEVLCRARAIEFQSYVVACGQWGPYQGARGETHYNYGNSLVCDPWGLVVARASEGVGWATVTLRKEAITEARSSIPMSEHRRALGGALGDERRLPG